MLLRSFVFLGVCVLFPTQVKSLQYLEDVIAKASNNLDLFKSGIDTGKTVYFSNGVALDVGGLNNETFPLLPENLRISIAGCHKLLIRFNDSSYDAVLARMMQSPLTQPKEDSSINRMDKFLSETKSWWNFLGKSEATKMQELNEWFQKLITDREFLASTCLNADSSISMAKTTTLILAGLRNKCKKQKNSLLQRDIINLSVLQYPQTELDSFVLHRVHLFGWVDCNTSNMNGGVTGEYSKRAFTSRYSIISKLSPSSRGKALKYIDGVFEEIAPKTESTTTTGSSSGSSITADLLLTSTTAAITTVASMTAKPDDEDDEVCE